MNISILPFFYLLLVPLILKSQSVANVIAGESCECIQNVSRVYIDDIEQLTNSCIQESISQNIEWLKQKYNWSDSPQEAEQLGEQIGKEVGEILVNECQALKLLLKSEEDVDVQVRNLSDQRPVSNRPVSDQRVFPETSVSDHKMPMALTESEPLSLSEELSDAYTSIGRLLALHGKEIATVVIVDEYGDRISFQWVTPFKGDDLFNYDLNTNEGRSVKIYWQAVELYHPPSRDYKKAKVIVGMEFFD